MRIGNPGRMQPFHPVAFLAAKPERIEIRLFANQGFGQIKPAKVLHNAVGRNRAGHPERHGQHFFYFLPVPDQHKDRQTAAHEPQFPIREEGLKRVRAQDR